MACLLGIMIIDSNIHHWSVTQQKLQETLFSLWHANVPIRSTLHWNTVRHCATYKYLKVIQPASHSSADKLSCRRSFKQIQPLAPATTLAPVCRRRRRQTRRTGGVNRTVVRSPPLHPEVTVCVYIRTTPETYGYHTDDSVCIIQWRSKLTLTGPSSNKLAFTS
jgi:hypothetical protein